LAGVEVRNGNLARELHWVHLQFAARPIRVGKPAATVPVSHWTSAIVAPQQMVRQKCRDGGQKQTLQPVCRAFASPPGADTMLPGT